MRIENIVELCIESKGDMCLRTRAKERVCPYSYDTIFGEKNCCKYASDYKKIVDIGNLKQEILRHMYLCEYNKRCE